MGGVRRILLTLDIETDLALATLEDLSAWKFPNGVLECSDVTLVPRHITAMLFPKRKNQPSGRPRARRVRM